MRIARKLIIHTVIIAVTSVFVSGVLIASVTYINAKNSLEEVTKSRFISYRNIKAEQIQNYFENIKHQIIVFSNDLMIIDAVSKFTIAFNKYASQSDLSNRAKYRPTVVKHYLEDFTDNYAKLNGGEKIDAGMLINTLDDTSFDLQYHYILKNPYVLESKSKFNYAKDGTDYSKVHRVYHPRLRELQERLELYDIFLVDSLSGKVIYTVSKELDFTTSLYNGAYSNSGIGKVFRRANNATTAGYVTIEDFSEYLPSYNKQASFIASPIFDEFNRKVGVLIFQLSIDAINNIMTNKGMWKDSGLGDTGESYLIGPDYLMRSDSRFFIEDPEGYLKEMERIGVDKKNIALMSAKKTNIGLQSVTTVAAKEVIAGNNGTIDYIDYRGMRAISSYEPLNIPGLNWGIICGIDADEALYPAFVLAEKIVLNVFLIIILISAAGSIIGSKLSKKISIPIENLCKSIRIVSKSRDLTKRISIDTNDEIGDISKAINELLTSFQRTFQDTIKSSEQIQVTAGNLKKIAMDNSSGESSNDNIDLIKESEENLEELTDRLQELSNQFKFLEDEADKVSGW